jgi:transcriptional regulator with XRE-family HTH domain
MCEILGMKQKFTPPAETPEFAKLLASKVKVSAGYASDLARGKRVPSLSKAIEFERAYGIPCDFWEGRSA